MTQKPGLLKEDVRRRIHPQAVPRGILRFYLLFMLSRGPETGYSIMTAIDEKTEGAWKPGPGTVYPLLKELEREGLIETESAQGESSIVYAITEKGRASKEEIQRVMLSAGRKEHVMLRLFADILPPEESVSIYVRRQREMFEIFKEVSRKVPLDQRNATFAELHAVLSGHLSWLELQGTGKSPRRRKQK